MSSKKYKSLTISEKKEIIQIVEKGEKSKSEIAKDFNIPLSTLSTFLKNKEKIFEVTVSKKRKRTKNPGEPEIDKAMVLWFSDMRSKNINIDGTIIKTQAEVFAKMLDKENFKASNGWLEKWCKRNDIVFKSSSGESASVDFPSAVEWMNSLDPIIREYEAKNIFNADETGLFFKCTPKNTFAFKGDPCFGGKKSKDRVTILVGANMDGSEKLPLLMIGKSKHPRCFRNIKSKPLAYKSNTKSWMTASLFEQ